MRAQGLCRIIPAHFACRGSEKFLRRLKRPASLAALAAFQQGAALPAQVRILGLDPGSLVTGYAVIELRGVDVSYLASGTIRAQGDCLTERLQDIFEGVDRLTGEYRPEEVAVERIFMHRNADSALKLGQARGAALCATFALRPRVFEYAPREVKQAVVGSGAAEKQQVQSMVKRLLKLTGPVSADAADALAIALCHAHSRRLYALTAPAAARVRERPARGNGRER